MVKKIAFLGLCLAAAFEVSRADTTTVGFDSGGQTMLNQGASALTGGSSTDGNGAVIQLGYFTGSTATFTGTWVALSGEGTLNSAAIITGSNSNETYNKTSIGDLNGNGAGDGTFGISLDFGGTAASSFNLPSSGIQLAIRFYNGTTIAGSSFFNTVTDSLWTWKTPATPPAPVNMTLDDAGLVWQSIFSFGQAGTTAFHTSIATAIPEPSTLACLLLGGAGTLALGARRRSKS
jgi:hypothetical protein